MPIYRLFFILLLCQACASLPDKKLVENGLTLRYSPASDIESRHLQHPVQITEDDVHRHLQALWYEEMTARGRKGRVFSESEVNKISRLLTKALNHASPNKIVRFELAGSTGATDVEVFVESDQIHWRFQSIKGSVFTCDISQAKCLGVNWRLVPKEGQRYFTLQKLLGTKNMENWIVENLKPASGLK